MNQDINDLINKLNKISINDNDNNDIINEISNSLNKINLDDDITKEYATIISNIIFIINTLKNKSRCIVYNNTENIPNYIY